MNMQNPHVALRAALYLRVFTTRQVFRDHFELDFNVRKLAKNGVKLVSITQEMGDDPHARHDAADHGAVRRIPVQGER